MTDWRALCAELVSALADFTPFSNQEANALARARAALAQPEPEAVGPSDDDLALIYHDCCGGCEFMDQGGFEDAARALLARWGHQPAPPAEGEVEKAALVRRMCEIILGNTSGNEELDSLALLVGHHSDVLNASMVPVPVPVAAEGEV